MDEATKKLIEDQVAEQTKGLADKNQELIDELKKAKGDLSKFADVDLTKLAADSKKLAKLEKEKLESDSEYEKLYKKATQDHEKEIGEFKTKTADLQTKLAQTIKENALQTALVGVKVIPELSKVAVTSLINEVGLNDEGEPVVGSKPVTEYVKKWAESEVGKHFIIDGNAGGGGKGSGGGNKIPEADFYDPKSGKFNLTEQSKVANKNPELHKKLVAMFPKSANTQQ